MAQSVGQIGLDLVVNRNQFDKQMSGITNLAKKAGVALASAFAVKKLVGFGKQCIELGSDLAEVQNVVDVTFPSMSKQVDSFAKNAASSFGLSETMAKRFTGTFGAMAKAFGFSEKQAYDMSITLTGLAGDVASFYNISQDEAYTKLKSVFTGETETLKDLGIVMTQNALDAYAMANGWGKTTQAMSEAEKVALRYQFVQSQLTAASGDFTRTADSWANQVRVLKLQFDSLKATLGQGLINVLTPVLKVLNTLLGKLVSLASAFKGFTELITGKKSESGSGGVGALNAEVGAAGDGLEDAAGSADNLADKTSGVGKAAKKAAKDMRALMGFDQIQKLSDPSDTSDSGDDTSDGGGTGGVGAMDFGSLAEGDTVLEQTGSKMQGLIDRCKELAKLFKKGFVIGFGDSEKRIESIKKHVKSIGKSLNDIFTDPKVTSSANRLFDAIALNAGKVAGSMTSIGITIADNLVGGIDKYLQGSKEFIKERLVSIFDVSARISGLVGDYSVAFADVFSIFSGDNAKQCTASLIGIFSDGFLGVLDIALQFGADIIEFITRPFVENKDKIKEAIDNTLAPISEMLETLHQGIKDVFEKINQVYEEHIHPMFQSFTDGISEVVEALLDGYNEYIAPVLDDLADKFEDAWDNHIKQTIDKFIEFIGKVADLVRTIWEELLQPFLKWIAENIFPVIAPILERLGNKFMDVFNTISDVIGGLLRALGGLIDFIIGAFTGDWERAWNGIKDIFGGIWDSLGALLKDPINSMIDWINGLVSAVASGVNDIADMLNDISIPDNVPVVGGLGFNLSYWTPGVIPHLAQGGFVKANTPRLAMIGDNRHYGEIVAPEDKMQAMVNAAVKAVAGSGGVSKAELESIINNAVMRIVAALGQMGFFVDGQLMARAMQNAMAELDYLHNPVKTI